MNKIKLEELSIKLYMLRHGLVEDEVHIYSPQLVSIKKAYVFYGESQFIDYFRSNGVGFDIDEEFLKKNILKKTKSGLIISLKRLDDYLIRTYLRNKKIKSNYCIPIDEEKKIHEDGLLTSRDMVKEWETNEICAPGANGVNAQERCSEFEADCHECLIEFASNKKAHTPNKNTCSNNCDTMKLNKRKKQF